MLAGLHLVENEQRRLDPTTDQRRVVIAGVPTDCGNEFVRDACHVDVPTAARIPAL